jgi:penicillin-binding protein 2
MFRSRQDSALLSISLGACVVFTLLFLRLGHIQLINGAMYLEQADDNRFFEITELPPRGLLLDRYGEPLVWNTQQYLQVNDPKALFSQTHAVSREDALQLIATQGAQATASRLQRFYRFPKSLAHFTGYVGEVTAEDLQRDRRLKPGMIVGKAGLELRFEEQLRGQEGSKTYEVDAHGKKQRVIATQEAVQGESIYTSVDPYLSEVAVRKLGDVRGTVIITDTETGKVLSLVSLPEFDPNVLSQVAPTTEQEIERKKLVQGLFQDPRQVFFNRAISGAYPPGSVFKLVTATAGLEHGKLDSNTEVIDEGMLKVGEFQFGNWYFRQYGRVEGAIVLRRAIARSNDIYFYKAAEWVGPITLAEVARNFGFAEKTQIELPAEARGLIPDPVWKEKVRGEPWYLGNTYHFGIGQGDVLTTPIQVAQMTQAIANDGKLCTVSVLGTTSPTCKELGYDVEHLKQVKEGMLDACSSGGTAYPFFPFNTARLSAEASLEENLARSAVACKTGTAEFGGVDEQGYRNTHAWFTMFLELPSKVTEKQASASAVPQSSSPIFDQATEVSDQELHRLWSDRVKQKGFPKKIAITVLVESDDVVKFREGSRDASPIAKQIVDWLVLE